MKFTVVFNTNENCECSYGLVFTPTPVWIKEDTELINLNPENPHYQMGSIKRLTEYINLGEMIVNKNCTVIKHNNGNGSEVDLLVLRQDLQNEGFCVNIVDAI